MGLFQRRPSPGLEAPLYTTGQSNTVLIVGLGNPGKQYENTRHNLGFACLDEFAKGQAFPGWVAKKDLKSHEATNNMGGTRVILVKPQTFMNVSGEAVRAVQQFYKINNQNMLIVHDELDVPLGQIRIKRGGGSAGHNGLKSIIEAVGDDFMRLRVGIGPKSPEMIDSADFVLAKFTESERENLPAIIREACSIIGEFTANQNLPPETRSTLA